MRKIAKGLLCFILSLSMLPSALVMAAEEPPFGPPAEWQIEQEQKDKWAKYYEYEIREYEGETAAVVIGYSRKIQQSEDGAVEVPRELGGCPVRVIESNAFANQPELWWLRIPETVKEIGAHVVANCKALKLVNIGRSVKKIDEEAFAGINSDKEISFSTYAGTYAEEYFKTHGFHYGTDDCVRYQDAMTGTYTYSYDTSLADKNVVLKVKVTTEGEEFEALTRNIEQDAVLYDLAYELDGEAFDFEGKQRINIWTPSYINEQSSVVYRVEEDGSLTKMDAGQGDLSVSRRILGFDDAKLGKYLVVGTHMFGDIDRDLKFSSADALEILKMSVGIRSYGDMEKEIADVDGDGKVSAKDALYLLKRAVGLIPVFPVEGLVEEC